MAHIAERAESKSMLKPDEVRDLEKTRLEIVKIDGKAIIRATLQPGWRWSKHLKPFVKTRWCEAAHFHYQVSGELRIKLEDGTELTSRPGDVVRVPPGHDAWVVGDQEAVVVDFEDAVD